MTASSITSYSRFSDSLERELLDVTHQQNRSYPLFRGLGIVARIIGRSVSAFGRYLVQVAEALNEARARDARYSGTQW